jgi:hypothetical protein
MNKIDGNLHATGGHSGTICMQLAARRIQILHPNGGHSGTICMRLAASRIQFLHPSGGPSGTICLRLAFKSATELNDSLMVYMNYFMTFFTTPCIKLFCDSREEG